MTNQDILEKEGKQVPLLGNEAIVRGALEAGLGFSTSYPGTPSSEVGMTLASIAKKLSFYFEWSTNEKVAFEAAAGAAFCGVPSLCAMKHFGLNVAADSVFPVVYTGVKNSLVLMVADDPTGFSSAQSEQDSRHYSRLGLLPTLEPSCAQECKDLTLLAFEMSKRFQIPVMLRTTTKVSHSIGSVKLGKIKKPLTSGKFVKESARYYNLRPNLQKLHEKALEKLGQIEKRYAKLNKIEGKGEIGIITNGVTYEYVRELELKKVKIAKLTLTYPISRSFITQFIKGLKTVIIVEELEPIVEYFVKGVAYQANPKLKIYGKDILPQIGEYTPDIILEAIAPILKLQIKRLKTKKIKIDIPTRKPTFCPGCPHRSTFYAAKKVLGKDTIWAGDIGCYMMGIFEPYQMQDFLIAMGADQGISHGIKKVSKKRVCTFIGDSTFFHAGMPGLVNMVHNKSKSIVVIMNNDITAMTGQQPHPGSGQTAMSRKARPIKIENVVRSFGIKNIKSVNAYNQKELQKAFKELAAKDELGVLISNGVCRLLMKRKFRKQGKKFSKYEIDPKKCIKCGICTRFFACPAIQEGKEFSIDPEMCWGCGVCAQICPVSAIKVKK